MGNLSLYFQRFNNDKFGSFEKNVKSTILISKLKHLNSIIQSNE